MTHPIIKTDNYLLVVDDSEIKTGDYVLSNLMEVNIFGRLYTPSLYKKIIAHLPINAPILEGVPLLPPLEDDVEKLEMEYFIELEKRREVAKNFTGQVAGRHPDAFSHSEMIYMNRGYIEGYNKAKEKYKFTKEDLFMLAAKVVNDIAKNKGNTDWNMFTTPKMIAEEFIQQPKYPVAFECEIELYDEGGFSPERNPKTITNSQGLIQVVGKYIY
jgi:hypothetical protein